MDIKEIKSKKLFKEYQISLPSKAIDEQIDIKIKEIALKKTLPGFRPGKAPIPIVRQKYEKDILGEVINKTLHVYSKKLLEQKKIKPLRFPKIEITKFDKKNSLEFNIKIDLPPDIRLCNFKEFELTNYKIRISNKDINNSYNDFIKNLSDYKSIKKDRALKKDDQVIISFKTNDKNAPDVLKKQENIKVIIGSKYQILPNVDEILVSKKIKKGQELKVPIKVPISNKNSKINDTSFDVKVIDIQEPYKVNLDKEYLKKMNLNSIDELKKQIENTLNNQYKTFSIEIYKKQLLDLLESKHSFELPDGILEDEFNLIWDKVQKAKKNNTLDKDDISLNNEELKKRYEKIAFRRIKIALIMSEIAKENKIEVNNEEISNGIKLYAKNYPGQEKQIFDYFNNNPREIEMIKGPIFEKKVIDYISEQAKKIDKYVDTKEINDIQAKIFK